MSKPVIIGIAGGSCSGKTIFASRLAEHFGKDACVIPQDAFYISTDEYNDHHTDKINDDHPLAFDYTRMSKAISDLSNGRNADFPIPDYECSPKLWQTRQISPRSVIIVEGLYTLHDKHIRSFFDLSIFLNVDEATRLERRVLRNVSERNEEREAVVGGFYKVVKPMHDAFIDPTRAHADIILDNQVDDFESNLGLAAKLIGNLIGKK